MTVSTLTNSVTYLGNGSTTQFAVPFKVLDVSHLVVKRLIASTGEVDHTYIGTDYSYSGIGADAGTLTLSGGALSSTYKLSIERIVPYTQELDLVNVGGFYPETVETQLDLMTMGIQQIGADTQELFGDVATMTVDALAAVDAAVSHLVVTSATGQTVTTRTLLAAIGGAVVGQTAYLSEAGRQGMFEAITTDAAAVASDPGQGVYVAGSGVTWRRIYRTGELCLSWFGTVGDGITNDTTAVQRAINFAVSLSVAKIICPSGVYLVTNLVVPSYADTSPNPLKTLHLEGVVMPSTLFGSAMTGFQVNTKGAIFKSAATTGGSLLSVASSAGFGGFSWYHIVLDKLTFRLYDAPLIHAVDMGNASQLTALNLMIDSGVFSVDATKPPGSDGSPISGLITPKNDNAALVMLRNINVSGFYAPIQVNEHVDADEINLGAFIRGLLFNAANHASRFGRVLCFRGTTPVAFAGTQRFSIQQLDVEHSITAAQATNPADLTVGNGYQVTQEDFRDITNGARGYVNWHVVKGGVGSDDTFVINGAAHVQFRQLGEAIPALALATAATQSIASSTTASAITLANYGTPEAGVAVDGSDATKINIARQGTYRITARLAFASNATGYRQAYLELNGTGIATDAKNAINGAATWLTLTTVVGIAATGVLKVKVAQNSGGALNLVAASDAGVITIEKLRDQAL